MLLSRMFPQPMAFVIDEIQHKGIPGFAFASPSARADELALKVRVDAVQVAAAVRLELYTLPLERAHALPHDQRKRRHIGHHGTRAAGLRRIGAGIGGCGNGRWLATKGR